MWSIQLVRAFEDAKLDQEIWILMVNGQRLSR